MSEAKAESEFVSDRDIDAAFELGKRVDKILTGEENIVVAMCVTEIIAGIVGQLHGPKRAEEVRDYLANAYMVPEPLESVN
jgi:hypothetical protein